jgi:hypothetical protein
VTSVAYQFSTKSVGSCRQKSENLKNFYLLFSHRVTSDERRETGYIFDSNAHIRPIIEGRVFLQPSFRDRHPEAFVLKIKDFGFHAFR